MNLQCDQAVSARKIVGQPKPHLSKARVGHGTHIFRGDVVWLAITIGKTNSNC